jgi:hypothetical protein
MQAVKALLCTLITYVLINSLMMSDSVRFWGRIGQSAEGADEDDKVNARRAGARLGLRGAGCQRLVHVY